MIIRSLEGDDEINKALMNAMYATIRCLVNENLLTEDQANKFLDQHICIAITKDGGFSAWLKRVLKKEELRAITAVVKILS